MLYTKNGLKRLQIHVHASKTIKSLYNSLIKICHFFCKATLSTYGEACSINNGCDQTQNLQCSVTNQTLYVCLCSTYFFWSTAQTKCLAQYLVNKPCNNSNECRNDLGLYCNTTGLDTCVCNSTHYWDTLQLACGKF
jgi:hypothetical protein